LFLATGILLVALGLSAGAWTWYPVVQGELTYQQGVKTQDPNLEMTPVDDQFGIVIPKIGANEKVIENTNPWNEAEYNQALELGVAHARGSATPDMSDHVFLFAHSSVDAWLSTRYNPVFYLVGKLDIGDEIRVYYKGNVYPYQVSEKKLVSAKQVDVLGRGENKLSLMTCWPPGTDLRRLIVTAVPQK
jgi:LPXTG-site transpeptidase (sortase) family protein